MNIKDVEKKTGLSKPNIRYYEEAGLITPDRGDNNYRVYSDSDVQLLNNIKKLRMLGLSIESIKAFLDEESSLADILARRLEEIDSDAGILRKQAEVCRLAIQSNIVTVDDLSINEKSETWQRRLAILLRDDIVVHKLSRAEFNRDVLFTYLGGCAIALVTCIAILLLGHDDFSYDNLIIIPVLAVLVFTGIVPIWTSNMSAHIATMCVSEIFTAFALWAVLQESVLFSNVHDLELSYNPATRIIFIMYLGLVVLALVCWTVSQLAPSAFKSAAVAFILALLYAGCVYGLSAMMCNVEFELTTKLLMAFFSLLLSLSLTMQWAEINKEKKSFNRYSAMVTASKSSNVIHNLISGFGYNRIWNVRRG